MLLEALLLLLSVSLTTGGEGTYNYHNPNEVWTGTCKTGNAQSPIDVVTPTGNEIPATWSSRKYTFNLQDSVNASFVYKSHTVFYDIALNQEIYVEDPTRDNTNAKIIQLHFHWGDNHTLGAEHHIDGVTHSAEMHLVTARSDGSLVVFNRFLQEFHSNDYEIGRLLKEENVEDLDLSLLYPSSINVILTYKGSLTTPPCTEIVTWVIIPEPLKISTQQADALRSWTYNEVLIGDTHRPIQPLNGRTIYGIKLTSDDTNDTDGSDGDSSGGDDGSKGDDGNKGGDDGSKDSTGCPEGQEKIMSSEGNNVCQDCNMGEFEWKGKCNRCPPGKSTVGTGSSYRDCLDNRYITCYIELDSYKCKLKYCPCNFFYEKCDDGICVVSNSKISTGETLVPSLILTGLSVLLRNF